MVPNHAETMRFEGFQPLILAKWWRILAWIKSGWTWTLLERQVNQGDRLRLHEVILLPAGLSTVV